jgi:hypothetical protein
VCGYVVDGKGSKLISLWLDLDQCRTMSVARL